MFEKMIAIFGDVYAADALYRCVRTLRDTGKNGTDFDVIGQEFGELLDWFEVLFRCDLGIYL